MSEKELYEAVTQKITVELHPVFKAILEECCENALQASDLDDEDKPATVLFAFHTCLRMAQAFVKAGMQHADTITLNYRGQTFLIGPDHPLLRL